jgi:hypothetical protein
MMKKIVLGMIIHSYNPSTLVAEAQEPWVWGHPEQHSETI